jgi:hypothetical protein
MQTMGFDEIKMKMPHSFFVMEAKLNKLLYHISQAVTEMYACGKHK